MTTILTPEQVAQMRGAGPMTAELCDSHEALRRSLDDHLESESAETMRANRERDRAEELRVCLAAVQKERDEAVAERDRNAALWEEQKARAERAEERLREAHEGWARDLDRLASECARADRYLALTREAVDKYEKSGEYLSDEWYVALGKLRAASKEEP